MVDIYVYYRCPAFAIEQYQSLGRQLIADLTLNSDVAAQLMVKKGEPLMLMEVYRGVTDDEAFCERMAIRVAAICKNNMAIQPDRHIEIFSAL